jgi:hypothetical protein
MAADKHCDRIPCFEACNIPLTYRNDFPIPLSHKSKFLSKKTSIHDGLVGSYLPVIGRSGRPSPVKRIVYLAGANLGSGWAHIGKGQLAKWARLVFQAGTERGVQALDALEFGSSWTLDLHLHFLQQGSYTRANYGIYEFVVIGT